jgi:hypothetical protein
MGVSAPCKLMENPEFEPDGGFDVYTKRPSGAMACQQVALVSAGTFGLIAVRVSLRLAA